MLTDNKTLISVTQRHCSRFKDRETRQLDYFSQLDLDFGPIHGNDNVDAEFSAEENVNLRITLTLTVNLLPCLTVKDKIRNMCVEDHALRYQIFSLDDYNIYCYVCTLMFEFVLFLEYVFLY